MHHFSFHHFTPSRLTPLEYMPVNQLTTAGALKKYGIADGAFGGTGAFGIQQDNTRFRCDVLGNVNTDMLLYRTFRPLDETLALVPLTMKGKHLPECDEQTKETMYSPKTVLADCVEGTVIRENIVKKHFTLAEMKQMVEHYRVRQKTGLNFTPTVEAGLRDVHAEWQSAGGFEVHFKVLCIMLPRIKADYYGNTGILHSVIGAPLTSQTP